MWFHRLLAVRHRQGRDLGAVACSGRWRSARTRRPGRCCTGCGRRWCGRAGPADRDGRGGRDVHRREEHGLRGGRQPGKKVLTGIAVEVSEPKGIGRCRMAVLADASGASLRPFVAGQRRAGQQGDHRRLGRLQRPGRPGATPMSGAIRRPRPPRRGPRGAAARCPPGRLAVQAVAAGYPSGQGRPGAPAGLPQRVHLPVQPPASRSRGMVFYRVLELAAGHDPVRYNDIRATTKPRNRPPRQRGTGHPPSLDRPAADRPWRTSEMQLQFPLRLSRYPGTTIIPMLPLCRGPGRAGVFPLAGAVAWPRGSA